MKDAKFSVVFENGETLVDALNLEAMGIWEEFVNEFPGVDIMNFIVLSEHAMYMDENAVFIFELSLDDKKIVFEELDDARQKQLN